MIRLRCSGISSKHVVEVPWYWFGNSFGILPPLKRVRSSDGKKRNNPKRWGSLAPNFLEMCPSLTWTTEDRARACVWCWWRGCRGGCSLNAYPGITAAVCAAGITISPRLRRVIMIMTWLLLSKSQPGKPYMAVISCLNAIIRRRRLASKEMYRKPGSCDNVAEMAWDVASAGNDFSR